MVWNYILPREKFEKMVRVWVNPTLTLSEFITWVMTVLSIETHGRLQFRHILQILFVTLHYGNEWLYMVCKLIKEKWKRQKNLRHR